MTRYHGVLAPNARLRKKVVPAARRVPAVKPLCKGVSRPPPTIGPETPSVIVPELQVARPTVRSTPPTPATRSTRIDLAQVEAVRPDRRQMHRIDWAELLRRIYRVDALACPRCDERLTFIAVLTDRKSIRRVLDHLGESATGLPPVRVVGAWAG